MKTNHFCLLALLGILSCFSLNPRMFAQDAPAPATATVTIALGTPEATPAAADAQTAVADAQTAVADAQTAVADAQTTLADDKTEAGQTDVKAEEVAAADAPQGKKTGFSVKRTFWAILPALIAITLALITKEVYSSLFIGLLAGALMAGQFRPMATMDCMIQEGLIAAVQSGAGIFLFLVILGIMVALVNRTGAAQAFGNWAHKHVKTRIGACLATFVLGILIFIDDYFNCLTVGSVMLPVTDANKVSRAKLAYLIDATAAPICMIAPISSWAAAVSEFSKDTGYDGLELFIRAIPFNFYSLLTLVFVIAITVLRLDYGPMAKHEKNAQKGDLFTFGGEVDNGIRPMKNAKGKFLDLIFPVLVLILFCVAALVHVGGYGVEGKDFIKAFSDTDASIGLPWGGMIALIFTVLYLVGRRVISFRGAMKCIPEGFNAMVPAIMILVLAMALKNMTGLLELKEFIHDALEGNGRALGKFLPAIIFLVACGLSFSTGTSWGTFGILIPIVTNIFSHGDPLLFVGMSACLAGAVCGDHCSPISDTTIMSSAGARCEHINHVSTQLPYAITVATVSFVGFLFAGFCQKWFIVFPIMVLFLLGLLFLLKFLYGRKYLR